jgi:hypothetical protein
MTVSGQLCSFLDTVSGPQLTLPSGDRNDDQNCLWRFDSIYPCRTTEDFTRKLEILGLVTEYRVTIHHIRGLSSYLDRISFLLSRTGWNLLLDDYVHSSSSRSASYLVTR